ncbi:6-hydroxypseudooxynicotine dehydrogenase complex subunit gamma [archaeon HR01]|nr:6-hydroxypseudooxynicotine dehydrogenase complex subunit gamma [archaeon HR01]
MLGASIPPEENLHLVMGKGLYVDDVKRSNTLYLGVVRSIYPRALIRNIEVGDAVRISKLVIRSDDLSSIFKNTLMPATGPPETRMAKMPILASDRVNFVGQPIAALVCEDPYTLQDALELVSVEYEPLEPVIDPIKSLRGEAPVIHAELGSNICLYKEMGGDVREVFEKAEVVLEDEYEIHRVAPVPMEPRSTLAVYEDGRLTLHVASQGVFIFKQYLLENLAIPEDHVRIVQSDVGGAFGSKTPPYPEHLLAIYAAMRLGRPVKWVETRREHLTASNHSRDIRAKVSIAAGRDGVIHGLKASILADIGAYAFFVNPLFGVFTAQQVTGPYDIKAAYVEVTAVYTNKTPTGPYRGFSRPEAAFIYERALDMLADELHLDPVEVRRRNLVRLEKMPYKTSLGLELDREDYLGILDKALNLFNYQQVKVEIEAERKKGRMIGVGLANYFELNRAGFGRGEAGLARLEKDGSISVMTGAGPHGQGLATILRQIVAWEMGIPIERTRFLMSDSSLMKTGVGTFGSRSTVISGEAIVSAARSLRQLILEHASSLLRVPKTRLSYLNGYVRDVADPSKSVELRYIAEKVGPLEAHVFVEGRDIFSYGVHMAIVEVDRESGAVKLLRYVCVDDAGRIINPLLAEGQVIGGVAQAVGQVFYEEIAYSEDGQPLNVTISDAGLPTALEICPVESTLLEYPSGYSHGARGIGEAGTIAGLPTLVRAVENAIGRKIRTTNLKTEKVWRISNSE